MENITERLLEVFVLYGLRVLGALLIILVGRVIAKSLRSLIGKLLRKREIDETLVAFVTQVSYVAMMIVIIIAALGQIGIQTTSIIAVLGAAGLAVGFAMQSSLSNLAAGILLLVLQPYKVGDFIEGAGIAGTVEELGMFNTTLKTPDNRKIVVPNASMTTNNVINYSAKDIRRMDLVVGVSYGDDIDKVKRVLEEVLDSEERLLKDPPPKIGLIEMADSSINFVVRPWVPTAEYWNVIYDLQENIKKRLDAEGITIPFPQRDVHLYKNEQ